MTKDEKINQQIFNEVKNIVGFVDSSNSVVNSEDISNAVNNLAQKRPELFAGLSIEDVKKISKETTTQLMQTNPGLSEEDVTNIFKTIIVSHDEEEHTIPTLEEAKEYLGMKEV